MLLQPDNKTSEGKQKRQGKDVMVHKHEGGETASMQ